MNTTTNPLPSVQLASPAMWVKGSAGYSQDSGPCCMMGAVRRWAGGDHGDPSFPAPSYWEALNRIQKHLDSEYPTFWNDAPARTHAEVIAALKACGL